MPPKKTGKQTLAPTPVLLDALAQLSDQADDAELAYLLAVLMVRRRILTEVSDDSNFDGPQLQLVHNSDGREFNIPIRHPDSARAEILHQRLVELLYCDS
jgi:hypothetical protein